MLEKHKLKFSGEIGTNKVDATENELGEQLFNLEQNFNSGEALERRDPLYKLHINTAKDNHEIIVPFFKKISELSSDEIEALENLLNFYEVILKWSENENIGDLDEFPGHCDLINSAKLDGYIHTWVEDGRGISFTCWSWNKQAIELLNLLGYSDIIDPTEEYS